MKKLTFLLLAFVLTFAIIPLTGCGNDNPIADKPSAPSTSSTSKDTVRYMVICTVYRTVYSDSALTKLVYRGHDKIDGVGFETVGAAQRDSTISFYKAYKRVRFLDKPEYVYHGNYQLDTYENIHWDSQNYYNW